MDSGNIEWGASLVSKSRNYEGACKMFTCFSSKKHINVETQKPRCHIAEGKQGHGQEC